MRTIAKWCFVHRRTVLVTWVAAMIGLTAIHAVAGSAYSDSFQLPGTESFAAVKLLERAAPKHAGDTEQIVISAPRETVAAPAVRSRVDHMLAGVAALPHVTAIASPYGPRGAAQIAPSRRVAFANVTFDTQATRLEGSYARRFVSTARAGSGRDVQIEVDGQVAEAAASNGAGGVPFGFLAAGVVLFIVFGSLAAMALPLLSTALSLGTAVAVIGLLSHVLQMPSFSNEFSVLIGLGVGVDYALFIITRYRQALARGLAAEQAVVEAVNTSGRAVLFAGMVVCIAMLGLTALGLSFLSGAGIATSVAVACTVLAALTLLPALLGLFGTRVLRRRERRSPVLSRSDESQGWARWATVMRRRPALLAALAAGLMVLIAIPFTSMRLGAADAGTDPSGSTTRKAYDLLAKGFGPGYNAPLTLVARVSGPGQEASFVRIERAVASTRGVAAATSPRVIPGTPSIALADVYPKGSPQDASTADLLHTVRDRVIPAAARGTGVRVLVSGQTATLEDFSAVIAGKLPLFLGVVVLLSFLLLMAVFRSLLVPLIAAAMNLLSVAAALGVVTAIFQDGIGSSLLAISKTAPISAYAPVMMFAILFGLSMDYEVFLVSRIHEEWQRRRDNQEAVAHGLAATGRTITAAAAIMVLVFGAFVLDGQWLATLFGIGLASAVLLDALLVRSVLVPALMLLIGEANWKLPGVLARLLPHLRVEAAGSPDMACAPSPERTAAYASA